MMLFYPVMFRHCWGICGEHVVGGIPTPLKNMSSSVGMIIPNIWKNKKCSKPPTSKHIKKSRPTHGG
jgi:hypothetical protein